MLRKIVIKAPKKSDRKVILASLKTEFPINKCCESFIRVKIPSLVWVPALIAASLPLSCLPAYTVSAPVWGG